MTAFLVLGLALPSGAATPQQIALTRWYGMHRSARFTVGASASAAAFDGEHIWIGNPSDGVVLKIRPSDGSTVATYSVATGADALAYDGASMWIGSDSGFTRLRASDGSV